ncbi:MAG TPA: autotransporter domain-containing protein [Caulobacteraceae bacterium]
MASLAVLACAAQAGPARATADFFLGHIQMVPLYGVHPTPDCFCGDGVGNTTIFDGTGDLFSGSSYNLTPGYPAPGPNDSITVGGDPPVQINAVQGPNGSVGPDQPVFGYVVPGGYQGNGMKVFGSGTVGSLFVTGPGEVDPGTITVADNLILGATGNLAVTQAVFIPPGGQGPGAVQFLASTLLISGGNITSQGLVQISAASDNQSLPGVVEISKGTVGGVGTQLYTGGNDPKSATGANVILVDNGGTLSGSQDVDLMVQPLDGSIAPASNTFVSVKGGTIAAGNLSIGVIFPSMTAGPAGVASLKVVDGALTLGNSLVAGFSAPGSLNVTGSSKITTGAVSYVALLQGSGGSSVTLDGSNVEWDDADRLYVGANDVGNLTVTNHASLTTDDLLVVGLNNTGVGNMTVSAGGLVLSDSVDGSGFLSGDIGDQPQAVGVVTVTGKGSSWENVQSLAVGYNGTGTLTVADGGTLTVDGIQLRVARNPGSLGSLTVTDAGTMVEAPNAILYVGFGGSGLADIRNGAEVDIQGVDIGGQSTGMGTLTLDGSGTKLNVTGADASVDVGDMGMGALNVGGGAKLDLGNVTLVIGDVAGSSGTVSISSAQQASNLSLGPNTVIGNDGKGELDIVGSGKGDTSTITPSSTGTVTIGAGASGVGILSIKDATLDLGDSVQSGKIVIGQQGNGTVIVGDGGELTAGSLLLGAGADAGSNLVVNAPGGTAAVTISGTTDVGAADSSKAGVSITAGNSFTTGTLLIGDHNSTTAAVSVTGFGSTLTDNGDLTIGSVSGTPTQNGLSVDLGATATAKKISVLSTRGDIPSTTLNALSVSFHGSSLTFDSLIVNGASSGVTGDLGAALISTQNGAGPDVQVINGGSLTLMGGATLTAGTILLDDGGALAVTAGSIKAQYLMAPESTGGSTVNSFKIDGGSVTLSKDVLLDDTASTITNGGSLSAATLILSASLTVSGGSTVTISGPPGSGGDCCATQFSPGADVKVTDSTLNLTGGLMADQGENGGLTFAGSSVVNVTGDLQLGDASDLDLNDTAQLLLSGSMSVGSGDVTLNNNSLLQFTGGNGALTLNLGSVEVSGAAAVHGLASFTLTRGLLSVTDNAHLQITQHLSTFGGGTVDALGGVIAIGTTFPNGSPFVYTPPASNPPQPTLTSGFVIVGGGGLLDGTGTIQGNLINLGAPGFAGVVHPGHSPGTLTITGDYIQGADGQLLLSIGPSSYSQLVVSGSVTLNGGTIVLQSYQGGQLLIGQQYDFIQAAGGITGQVSQIIAPNGFTMLSPDIVGGTLSFTAMHVPGSFAAAAATPNQHGIGAALDRAGMDKTGPIVPLVDAISALDPASLPATLDALSPEGLVAAENTAFGAQHGFDSAIETAAVNPALASAAPVQAGTTGGGRVWFAGFGADGRFSSQPARGLVAADDSGGGMALGVDHLFGRGALVGVALGASQMDYAAPGRSTSGAVSGAHVAAYGQFSNGSFYASAIVSYAHFDDTSLRRASAAGFAGVLNGAWGSDLIGGRLELGWRISAGQVDITPFAAIEGLDLRQGRDSEVVSAGDAAPLALVTPGQWLGSAIASIGLNADARLDLDRVRITPSLQVAYGRELSDRRDLTAAFASAPGALFEVAGAAPGQDSAHFALGIDAAFVSRIHVFARVATDQARGDHEDDASLGVRLDW